MVIRLAEKQEPQVANVLRGLKGLRVNVIGLDESNRDEVKNRIAGIRTTLSTPAKPCDTMGTG